MRRAIIAALLMLGSPAAVAADLPMPATERAYVAAIEAARTGYEAAPNELKKSAVAADLQKKVMAAVPQGKAEGWVGRLDNMGTTGDGRAYVSIRIAEGMTVKTWSNGFSDSGDSTLISQGSRIYASLSDLAEGAPVRFTAQLMRTVDLTERGRVEEPDMLARFTKIEALPQ